MTSNSTAKTPSTGPFRAVQICLAVLLLIAAGLKTHQLATEPVLGSGLLDSRWFLIAMVKFELFFAFWLIAGLLPIWTWRAAIALFTAFACVSLGKAFSGEASCGCFGRVSVSPWFTFALDLSIVCALLCVRASLRALPFDACRYSASGFRLAIMTGVWLLLGVSSGVAMGSYRPILLGEAGDVIGDGGIVVLEPEHWLGKPFPLLSHVDTEADLTQGEWTVVLYHHDCAQCRRLLSIGRIGRGSWSDAHVSVALIELPPYADDASVTAQWLGRAAFGRVPNGRRWFCMTPISLALKDGVVESVEVY